MTSNTTNGAYCRRRYQQAAAYEKHLQTIHLDIVLLLGANTDLTASGLPAFVHNKNINRVYLQKPLALRTHNARIRTSLLRLMGPLRPRRLRVLCVSRLPSGASQRPFLLLQAPCVLVTAHSVLPLSATLPFRPWRLAYSYQIVRFGCCPRHSPTSSGLDLSAGIPERFIRSLLPTAIL